MIAKAALSLIKPTFFSTVVLECKSDKVWLVPYCSKIYYNAYACFLRWIGAILRDMALKRKR